MCWRCLARGKVRQESGMHQQNSSSSSSSFRSSNEHTSNTSNTRKDNSSSSRSSSSSSSSIHSREEEVALAVVREEDVPVFPEEVSRLVHRPLRATKKVPASEPGTSDDNSRHQATSAAHGGRTGRQKTVQAFSAKCQAIPNVSPPTRSRAVD